MMERAILAAVFHSSPLTHSLDRSHWRNRGVALQSGAAEAERWLWNQRPFGGLLRFQRSSRSDVATALEDLAHEGGGPRGSSSVDVGDEPIKCLNRSRDPFFRVTESVTKQSHPRAIGRTLTHRR
jgi:hypothetical protein